MKKVLLLGAFAALFIACDKNDSDFEVMNELATTEINAEIADVIYSPSLLGHLKTPEAIETFMGAQQKDQEASRTNGLSFEDEFGNWKERWADQFATHPDVVDAPREGTGEFITVMPKYNQFRNKNNAVWLRLVHQGTEVDNSHNTDITIGTDDYGKYIKFISNINATPSVYGHGRNRNEISTKAFDNGVGGVYNREVVDIITFEMPTENFHQAMVFQNKLKGGVNGWFTSLDHSGTVKMRIRGLTAKDLDYPGRLVPGNVYTFYFLGKVTDKKDGYATFVIYDNTNREIIHKAFRQNVRTTSLDERVRYMGLRNGMYCDSRRLNELKVYRIAQYVSPVVVNTVDISATNVTPDRCQVVDFTIDTADIISRFTKVTIQNKNNFGNVWGPETKLTGVDGIYNYSRGFACRNTASEVKVRVKVLNGTQIIAYKNIVLSIQ